MIKFETDQGRIEDLEIDGTNLDLLADLGVAIDSIFELMIADTKITKEQLFDIFSDNIKATWGEI